MFPILRKVRNTIYEFIKNRNPIIKGLGIRTNIKQKIIDEINRSLQEAFISIIAVSKAYNGNEVSAIVLINKWNGKLIPQQEIIRYDVSEERILDNGIIIDTIGDYNSTELTFDRIHSLPDHIEQISIHTHPEGDVTPSEDADMIVIPDRFKRAIDDIHFIISYDHLSNTIIYRQLKNIF